MRQVHLFTDFSFKGPYLGEVKSVLARNLEDVTCIDLMHDAPKFNPKASAYLLAALSQQFNKGDSCLAIVDPEVGSKQRRPVLIIADDIVYCGPDNGLFSIVIKNAKNTACYEVIITAEPDSKTFHGRDLFAPSLAKYLNNNLTDFNVIDCTTLVGFDWDDALNEIIYFDGYGNAVIGRRAHTLSVNNRLSVNGVEIESAEIFSSVAINKPFWYMNSMGLVEIAVNQGSAQTSLNLNLGQPVTIII